ncbi:hypothetical protein AC579_1536 [Pseudocercospora musae]|uniref:Uncharacterized protein n=1 Tax=Pseudocercospora musae TaxID=113226 RepID=A0A139ILW6_9PEZI|nr:hypothetical protein AC579_1536 [Pseudocercospora musae]
MPQRENLKANCASRDFGRSMPWLDTYKARIWQTEKHISRELTDAAHSWRCTIPAKGNTAATASENVCSKCSANIDPLGAYKFDRPPIEAFM